MFSLPIHLLGAAINQSVFPAGKAPAEFSCLTG